MTTTIQNLEDAYTDGFLQGRSDDIKGLPLPKGEPGLNGMEFVGTDDWEGPDIYEIYASVKHDYDPKSNPDDEVDILMVVKYWEKGYVDSRFIG